MSLDKPNATGRSYGKSRSRKMRRGPNSPPESEGWGWMSQSMLESAAWLVCPDPARRAIMIVWTEHVRHAGQSNGSLPVTWRNFLAGGIRQGGISLALAQAQALGFIRLISNGRRSHGRDPGASHLWALTWLPIIGESQATHGWKTFDTVEEARAALDTAMPARVTESSPLGEDIDSATTVGSREMPDFGAMRSR